MACQTAINDEHHVHAQYAPLQYPCSKRKRLF